MADGYEFMDSSQSDHPLAETQPTGADTATPPEPPVVPGASSSETLQLLRGGPFTRYMVGEGISMTGTWMQGMAQGWVMSGLTQQAIWLGAVNFASSIPMLALTMFGGSLADRYDKRKILFLTQVVQIALALAIGFLVLKGQIQIWHILVAAVLLGISASFEMPAASALVPELVRKEQIASAIGIDRSVFHGTRFIGPALAGLISGWFGVAAAFFANAASFLALMGALVTIQPRAAGTEEEEKERSGSIWAGLHFVRQDRTTLAMLGLMSSASLCVFPVMSVMLPLYARRDLHLGVKEAGLLMSVSGVGSLVASIGMLSVPRSRRILYMIAGVVDVAVSLFELSRVHGFWGGAASLATLAVGTSLIYGLANTTVQERAPGPLRGRVSAVASLSFVGVMPFASLGMTTLADHIGMRETMIVSAALYAVAGFLIFTGPGRRCGEEPVPQPFADAVPAA